MLRKAFEKIFLRHNRFIKWDALETADQLIGDRQFDQTKKLLDQQKVNNRIPKFHTIR